MADANHPLTRFSFNTKRALETEKDVQLQINALETRIDRLINKVRVNDLPMLGYIFSQSTDAEELLTLAKALERSAKLLPKLNELKSRARVLELARTDPTWLYWAFGETADEVPTDSDLSAWLNTLDEGDKE